MIGLGFLASYSTFYGGGIGNLLQEWERLGVFSYVLPFLILFALIFGILSKIKIFGENAKGVNVAITLAVSLMALQFDLVPRFFAEVFPRVGVGLAIILILLILTGLFFDPSKSFLGIAMLIIGAVIVIVILVNTGSALGWQSGLFWEQHWGTILSIVLILLVIGGVVGRPGGSKGEPYKIHINKE